MIMTRFILITPSLIAYESDNSTVGSPGPDFGKNAQVPTRFLRKEGRVRPGCRLGSSEGMWKAVVQCKRR
jgi:hypothetical protein